MKSCRDSPPQRKVGSYEIDRANGERSRRAASERYDSGKKRNGKRSAQTDAGLYELSRGRGRKWGARAAVGTAQNPAVLLGGWRAKR